MEERGRREGAIREGKRILKGKIFCRRFRANIICITVLTLESKCGKALSLSWLFFICYYPV